MGAYEFTTLPEEKETPSFFLWIAAWQKHRLTKRVGRCRRSPCKKEWRRVDGWNLKQPPFVCNVFQTRTVNNEISPTVPSTGEWVSLPDFWLPSTADTAVGSRHLLCYFLYFLSLSRMLVTTTINFPSFRRNMSLQKRKGIFLMSLPFPIWNRSVRFLCFFLDDENIYMYTLIISTVTKLHTATCVKFI